jgi:hypothetical protein
MRGSSVVTVTPIRAELPEKISKSRRINALFCQRIDLKPMLHEQAATLPRKLPFPFDRLPSVACAADKDVSRRQLRARAAQLPFERVHGIGLHIDVCTPRLLMRMKPLHEPRVTVGARMGAATVAIHRIVADARLAKQGLAGRLANDGIMFDRVRHYAVSIKTL